VAVVSAFRAATRSGAFSDGLGFILAVPPVSSVLMSGDFVGVGLGDLLPGPALRPPDFGVPAAPGLFVLISGELVAVGLAVVPVLDSLLLGLFVHPP
jgi:hypothetical protein